MPSKIKVEIRAELRDARGKLLRRYPWVKANSLLKQFILLLAVQVSQANQTIKFVSGTDRLTAVNTGNLQANAAAAATTFGILIGTGTTPVAMTDYKLESQVSASITHGVVTFAVENPDANTYRIAITRIFTNATGASLGIREVAIYMGQSIAGEYMCTDRTLYSVDVPNGISVTLTYRITVTL